MHSLMLRSWVRRSKRWTSCQGCFASSMWVGCWGSRKWLGLTICCRAWRIESLPSLDPFQQILLSASTCPALSEVLSGDKLRRSRKLQIAGSSRQDLGKQWGYSNLWSWKEEAMVLQAIVCQGIGEEWRWRRTYRSSYLLRYFRWARTCLQGWSLQSQRLLG